MADSPDPRLLFTTKQLVIWIVTILAVGIFSTARAPEDYEFNAVLKDPNPFALRDYVTKHAAQMTPTERARMTETANERARVMINNLADKENFEHSQACLIDKPWFAAVKSAGRLFGIGAAPTPRPSYCDQSAPPTASPAPPDPSPPIP